jgi:2-isopropylmalate synthase
MAVANSLAGVRAGCRQVECTINGIGERAGNAALEEVVMAIKTRGDVLPYEVGVDATMLNRASQLVAAATSFPVQYNKAIVGRNAFRSKLKEMGYELGENALEDAFNRFKALADRKKHVYDEDIEALVDEEIAHAQDRIKLVSLSVIAGTRGPQRATMKLDIEGRQQIEECEGNGPVDAVFNCIKAIVPHEVVLELYQVHAVTAGTDAQAEVSVRLAHEGRSMTSKASDPDTLVASAKAYLGALNKIVMKRQRDMPSSAVAS